jgi:NADH:ubiquinone oxidoreductase subunit B-like Fe-S oxidoreductase
MLRRLKPGDVDPYRTANHNCRDTFIRARAREALWTRTIAGCCCPTADENVQGANYRHDLDHLGMVMPRGRKADSSVGEKV